MNIKNRSISSSNPCYIIAEIGHNHQGDPECVLDIIRSAAQYGANAVKFQKRNNEALFTKEFYDQPYLTANSFGKTYGEHREFLEPKIEWLKLANNLAQELGLDFIMTVFDTDSLSLCERELEIDAYKIQSADMLSHYLIRAVVSTGKPFFMSCGASAYNEIKSSVEFCNTLNADYCLMYAVSEYPTTNEHVHLRRIDQLKGNLPIDSIGFSCHHPSIDVAIAARSKGVVAIEKHFTLDKEQKGPDHSLSILPDDMMELRKRLDLMDIWLGNEWQDMEKIENYQMNARMKMGKSAYFNRDRKAGDVLELEDISFRSPANGLSPDRAIDCVGKQLLRDYKRGEAFK
jgi:sialic acid synthase